jgi:hypothetical protein
MAKKFKDHIVRDKPKKRGPRQHKKSKNKSEKGRNGLDVTRVKARILLRYLFFHT